MFRRRLTGLVCATVLTLSGCAPKGDDGANTSASPAPASPINSTPQPAPAAAAEPSTPPAESSLSIKRGIITAAGDHALFRACDDKAELWLVDEAESVAQMFADGTKAVYAEVYGERAPVPDDLPAARSHAGVFLLEQLLYAGNPGEGNSCPAALAADVTVIARGNEPFWSAQVTETSMIWKQPDAPNEIMLGSLQSEDTEGTVSYHATAEGHELQLLIDAQPCRDSMSGEFFAFASRAVLDGKEFTGCARVGK